VIGISRKFLAGKVGSFLCLALLFGQNVFPIAHEVAEAGEEAAYHQGDWIDASRPYVRPDTEASRRHHHHDPSTCGICLAFHRFAVTSRIQAPSVARRIATPLAEVLLESTGDVARGSASPRGPPAV
jgi:hypothetical protein